MAGCFMKRRAFIEFINKDNVKITNSYTSKEFKLNKTTCTIDLVNLKEVNPDSEEHSFESRFEQISGEYHVDIFCKTEKENGWERVVRYYWKDKPKENITANIWTE